MFPDRLVVRSPGSLFDPVTVEQLGSEGVSSSRNSFLAQILADTYLPRSERLVAENRASGIPTMIRELRESGLPRPRFTNHTSRFELEFSSSELLDPETRAWVRSLAEPGLGHIHEIALALMRHGLEVTNATLREYGVDRVQATDVLRDLVTRRLVQREGGWRYARYTLAAPRREGFEHADGWDDPGAQDR